MVTASPNSIYGAESEVVLTKLLSNRETPQAGITTVTPDNRDQARKVTV
jgi:hypothetical protein